MPGQTRSRRAILLASALICPTLWSQISNAPSLQTQHAARLLHDGQFPAAIEAYRKILRTNPHQEQATLGLGAAYRGIFNYDECRRLLLDLAKRYPGSGAALVELGKLDIHLLHYDDAVTQLKEALRRQPSRAEAHEQLGIAYLAKGEEATALPQLNEAIRLNPRSGSAYYFRGTLYAGRDDYLYAYPDAQQANRLAPNTQTHALLGKAATHMGKCDEAIEVLKPVAEPESSEPANLFLLAQAYKCAGQSELARKAQSEFAIRSEKAQAAKTQKMEADHLASQAGEFARANQLAAALDSLNQAMAKDPLNPSAHATLAKIEFSRGDLPKAKQEIATALGYDPYNPDYLYVLGKVLAKSDPPNALQAFEKVVLVSPEESDAYYEMGKIYLHTGQRTRARQAFKKAVELSPEDADYRKALAEAGGSTQR